MAFVSLQGTSLNRSQRERLQQQQAVKSSFLNPVLAQSLADTIKELDVRKEKGIKPERVWFLDRQETGTPCVAEWMGY